MNVTSRFPVFPLPPGSTHFQPMSTNNEALNGNKNILSISVTAFFGVNRRPDFLFGRFLAGFLAV
jgi:hypothetical protein